MKLLAALTAVIFGASTLAGSTRAPDEIAGRPDDSQALAIDHILIVTPDFARLTRWYIDVLGFEFEDRWTAPDVVPGLELSYLLHPGGARLEIVGGADVARPDRPADELPEDFATGGYRHVCFALDDLDATFGSAKERGARVLAEPFDYPRLNRRLAFIQDPDGNVVEFVSRMPGRSSVRPPDRESWITDPDRARVTVSYLRVAGRSAPELAQLANTAANTAVTDFGAAQFTLAKQAGSETGYTIIQKWPDAESLDRWIGSEPAHRFDTAIRELLLSPVSTEMFGTAEGERTAAESPPGTPAAPLLDAIRERARETADLGSPFVLLIRAPISGFDDQLASQLRAAGAATRAEPRNLGYHFSIAEGESELLLFEEWPDFSAMEHHVTLPQSERLMRVFAQFGDGQRTAELYRPITSVYREEPSR